MPTQDLAEAQVKEFQQLKNDTRWFSESLSLLSARIMKKNKSRETFLWSYSQVFLLR